MIVDVHVHFLSPLAIDVARKAPSRHGVRVVDDGEHPRLVVGNEAPTRPLLEALYTLDRHRVFFEAQGIWPDAASAPIGAAQSSLFRTLPGGSRIPSNLVP
jgi:hypothetical protein